MRRRSSSARRLSRSDMRVLWEDHVDVDAAGDHQPDGPARRTRRRRSPRSREPDDIGNAVKPFYGKAAGNKLTAELRKHILIAADVIAAAKAGDQAKLADAQARWRSNANDIARSWRVSTRATGSGEDEGEMSKHLALTTQEAVARLQGRWAADVAAYDQVQHHILAHVRPARGRSREAVPEPVRERR
jgi:hypothetical protein